MRTAESRNRKRLEDESYGEQLVSVVKHGLGSTLRLSPGALAFAKAIHDPFDPDLTPRWPILPILPTMVGRGFTHISSEAPSLNHVLIVNPARTLANDLTSVAYWQGGAPPTNLPNDMKSGTFPTGWTGYSVAQGPRASSDFSTVHNAEDPGTQYYGRLTALGVRIRFTGTELTRGGTVYNMVNPTLANLSGQRMNLSPWTGVGPTELLSKSSAFHVHRVTNGEWIELTFPIRYAEQGSYTQYLDTQDRWVNAGQLGTFNSVPTLSPAICDANSIMVWMKLPALATVDFQVHCYYEYYGIKTVQGAKSVAPDPVGSGIVQAHHVARQHEGHVHETGRGLVPFAQPGDHRGRRLLPSLLRFASKAVTHFAPKIERGALRAARAIIPL